jgi:hypothetical protein
MSDEDFAEIAILSDDLIEHGVEIDEFNREVVVPHKGDIYLVRQETTVDDIIEGNSVTIHIHKIVEIELMEEDDMEY